MLQPIVPYASAAVRLATMGGIGISGLLVLGSILFPSHLGNWCSAILIAAAAALAYSLILNSEFELRVIRRVPDAKLPIVKASILVVCGLVTESSSWYPGLGMTAGIMYQLGALALYAQIYYESLEKNGGGPVTSGWVGEALARHSAVVNSHDFIKFQEQQRNEEPLEEEDI